MSINTTTYESSSFDSWKDYWNFAQQVKTKRRYVWDDQVRTFLQNVLRTRKEYDETISQGATLWRAQLGVDYRPIYAQGDDEEVLGEEPMGFLSARMTPLVDKTRAGRVNSEGIPVLYLASSKKTAISEVRPWAGSLVSVAQFRILRDLKAINLSQAYNEQPRRLLTWQQFLGTKKPDPETVVKIIWSDIDNAFAQPVSRSENITDYIPTQILAELFSETGYDAVIYRSSLVRDHLNVAVFDLGTASILNCTAHEVSAIHVKYKQAGNTWFSRE